MRFVIGFLVLGFVATSVIQCAAPSVERQLEDASQSQTEQLEAQLGE